MHAESIKTIRYVGKQPTIDIEVDNKEHRYYANGVATSNSHAISYSINTYLCAFQKYHFPEEFFCSWLTYSKDKVDPTEEVYELVQDARMMGIKIIPPDIKRKNMEFTIVGPKQIAFGINYIKGIGASATKAFNKLGAITNFTDLLSATKTLKKSIVESLVKSGACDSFGLSRMEMLKVIFIIFGRSEKDSRDIPPEYRPLTDNELQCFLANIEHGYTAALYCILTEDACVKKRREIINQKIACLETRPTDTNRQKSIWERIYLGMNISCSAVDDIEFEKQGFKTCKEAENADSGDFKHPSIFKICCQVDKVEKKKTSAKSKTPDQDFAFLTVSDNSYALNSVVCWADKYAEFGEKLQENTVAILEVKKNTWNGRTNIAIQNVLEVF